LLEHIHAAISGGRLNADDPTWRLSKLFDNWSQSSPLLAMHNNIVNKCEVKPN
jgi:hypothetical protein